MASNVFCPKCNSTNILHTNPLWAKSKCITCGLYFDSQLEKLLKSTTHTGLRIAYDTGGAYVSFIEAKNKVKHQTDAELLIDAAKKYIEYIDIAKKRQEIDFTIKLTQDFSIAFRRNEYTPFYVAGSSKKIINNIKQDSFIHIHW